MDDAICAVVMMRRPVSSEEHLVGAFWVAVRMLLCHYHEGRGQIRVGSRRRAGFEAVMDGVGTGDAGPVERVEKLESLAQAADLMAGLDEFERRVVVAMAGEGAGLRLAARQLGVPVARVKAAVRSADEKLQQVAVIAAAGRMCGYRAPAITAHAGGVASEEQLRAASAHLVVCGSCRGSYVLMVREMRNTGLKRRGALAILPIPLVEAAQHLLRRLLDRVGFPRVLRDRVPEAFGGAGAVKAAAAGSAIVAATATLGVSLHQALEHPRPHAAHRRPPAHARHEKSHDKTEVARPRTDARASTAAAPRIRSRQRPLPAAYREFSFEARSPDPGHPRTSTTTAHVVERPTHAAKEFTFEEATR